LENQFFDLITFKTIHSGGIVTVKKIKIDKNLYEKCVKYSKNAGYSSVEEFIQHILEREVSSLNKEDDSKKIEEKLKGLGYIS